MSEGKIYKNGIKKTAGQDPAISVILPVYNVEEYIDQCMESIVGQTFADFEVLLIDDGSTDRSGEICNSWAAKDERVRAIHKKNGGVSSARNRGIEEAKGEFLAFVDPDDWLDLTYLEKLYTEAKEEEADFVECDIWRYNGKTGQKIHRKCWGTMGVPWTLEEHMKYGSTATYKSISKRSLWVDNGIRLPECAFESPAVYALLLAVAKRVRNVREPLYYYRRFRPESLIETGYAGKDGEPNNTLGIEAMEHLAAEFRRLGLCGKYQKTLEEAVKYRLSDILAMQFYRKKHADYRETEENFRAYLRTAFPDSPNERYITFGGYNLNRILVHLNLLHDPYCRFNFSSLISLADGNLDCGDVFRQIRARHKNRYREMMLQREEDRSIWQILGEMKPAYFFIDLMEERFDILEMRGCHVTASDAREEAETMLQASNASDAREETEAMLQASNASDVQDEVKAINSITHSEQRRIGRGSEECITLFRKASKVFVERVGETVPGIRFVIIENYLCEECGSMQDFFRKEPYENAEEIRGMNRVLEKHYAILKQACPDAIVIRPAAERSLDGLLFTDTDYEYGAIPSHLNEIANRRIAAIIQDRIRGQN